MEVIIRGEFKKSDLKEFAKVLRKAEQRNPEKVYTMLVKDEGNSVFFNKYEIAYVRKSKFDGLHHNSD
jgi:hypothetical protein